MWLKYADRPLTAELVDHEQKRRADDYRSEYEKPRGYWITDDSADCWRSWCEREDFALENLTHKHEVVLDLSNILILRTPAALGKFTRKFGRAYPWGPENKYQNWCIEWERVAQHYDGIIITPYHHGHRLSMTWYYGWDCASGCVWRARAIKAIRLVDPTPAKT